MGLAKHQHDSSLGARSGRHEHVFLDAADVDGDGFLDRLIVAAPWRCDRSVGPRIGDAAAFRRVISSLVTVRAGALGVLDVAPETAGIDTGGFLGPARIWESHTQYRPTRPIRGPENACDVLRHDVVAECRRRDLPVPEVEILDCPPKTDGRIAARLRLTFAVGVAGPLILGQDCRRGGGPFLAAN